jgi:prephenate dehydratase
VSNGTGYAAKYVSERANPCFAAIAGYDAAQLYNLQTLGIAHDTRTHPLLTKFWLLASKPVRAERHLEPRTSIAIRTTNRTGAFFRVLGCFAMRDINVVKIESKPHSKSIQHAHAPWEYELYVDVEGAPEVDEKVENALENLREFASQVVVLGSYPRYLVDDVPSMTPFGM